MTFCFVFGHEPWLLPPALEMVEVMKANGHTVHIIYAQNSGQVPDISDYNASYTFGTVPKKGGRLDKLLVHLRLRKIINKLQLNTKVDVLIACDIVALQAIANNFSGVKKGYWHFEMFYKPTSLSSLYAYRYNRVRSWLGKLDFYFTPSKGRLVYLENQFNTRKPSTIVYNCKRYTEPAPVTKNAYDKFRYKIIYTGRISAFQYISEIVAAMNHLPADACLIMAGPGDDKFIEELKLKIANDKSMSDRIFFLGRLSRDAAFELAVIGDIGFVLYDELPGMPTEPAPNKIGDYFAAGTWMIGTNQEYIHHWLDEKGAGITVNEISEHTLAKAMNTILSGDKYTNKTVLQHVYRTEMNMDVQYDKLMKLIQSV